MSELTDTLIEGLLEREAEEGSQLAWAGGNYPCSGGAEVGGKKLDLGGWKPNADVTVVLRTGALPDANTRPQEKQLVIYTSRPGATAKNLRIDSATLLYDVILVLECNDPNKPA
jgi:hypothetical protein